MITQPPSYLPPELASATPLEFAEQIVLLFLLMGGLGGLFVVLGLITGLVEYFQNRYKR